MALDRETVRRVATLARIDITDAELDQARDQLNAILDMINELQAIDTQGVEPMAHAQDVVLRLRADDVTEADQHALFQAVAPQTEQGLYLVPKVIE